MNPQYQGGGGYRSGGGGYRGGGAPSYGRPDARPDEKVEQHWPHYLDGGYFDSDGNLKVEYVSRERVEPLDGLGAAAVRPLAAGGTPLKRHRFLRRLGFEPRAHLAGAADHYQAHVVVLRSRVVPGRPRSGRLTPASPHPSEDRRRKGAAERDSAAAKLRRARRQALGRCRRRAPPPMTPLLASP